MSVLCSLATQTSTIEGGRISWLRDQEVSCMHPHTFYSTLFEHKKHDEIFVIMSFAPEFDDRWLRVIEPCIREDLGFNANRVDYNISGESIVHDILDGIAHSRLVLADITSSPMSDEHGQVWPQRNGNVMWELGVAHVMRVPDEVIVVRSDNDPSIFDLTQFRAFPYDPQDVVGSRRMLTAIATDRIRAVEQSASDHVKRCAALLDYTGWMILSNAAAGEGIDPPVTKTMGQVLGNMSIIPAIARLLDMGALTTSFASLTPEAIQSLGDGPAEKLTKYRIAPFGEAVLRYCAEKMGVLSPEMQPLLQVLAQEQGQPSRSQPS